MKLKNLLLSVFPALLVAPTFAGTINISPGQNVASMIGSANSGDTAILGSGTFNLNSPVTVPSGVTVTGTALNATHVVFNLPGGNHASYGFVIAGNASNVTIEKIDMYSNHGLIQMSLGNPSNNEYKNIVITRNNFQYGGGTLSDGSLVYGISGTLINDGLQITHNYFHDSQNSVRNWCVFYATNANFDYNQFYNIADGGQIQYPGSNVSFSYNYGTNIHRMAQESCTWSQSSVQFTGNVFYDWVSPYPDSFGISIVGSQSGEVDFTNNYFKTSTAAGSSWGTPDGSGTHRFGFAIEATGQPCNVTGNKFVGNWAAAVCSQSLSTNVWNNSVYGYMLWGNYDGQDGGRINAYNNYANGNAGAAPATPSNNFAGPQN